MNHREQEREQALLEQLAGDASALQIDEPDVVAGECFYCGCTETNACILDATDQLDEDFEPDQRVGCSWYRRPNHNGFAVCSNPECVKAYLADPGAP